MHEELEKLLRNFTSKLTDPDIERMSNIIFLDVVKNMPHLMCVRAMELIMQPEAAEEHKLSLGELHEYIDKADTQIQLMAEVDDMDYVERGQAYLRELGIDIPSPGQINAFVATDPKFDDVVKWMVKFNPFKSIDQKDPSPGAGKGIHEGMFKGIKWKMFMFMAAIGRYICMRDYANHSDLKKDVDAFIERGKARIIADKWVHHFLVGVAKDKIL